jgi:N-acetylglucosaminyl-diphospho-decaprenol L-rhamnosyltransferase
MSGLVKNCIKTVLESDLGFEYEIVVVDNNSKDGVAQLLKEQFPNVKLIESDKNLGMGGGNNIGMREANGEYILILNPDIHLFPDSIKQMIEHIESNPEIGLLAPKLLNPDKTLQHTCYRWHNFWTPVFRRTALSKFSFARRELRRFLMEDWDHENTQEVDWIQGSCCLVSRKVVEEVGYFDERFFMYFEDTDLCRRIKNGGYKNIYFPSSQVIHFHRRQSADSNPFFNRLTRTHIISWIKYSHKWRKSKQSA